MTRTLDPRGSRAGAAVVQLYVEFPAAAEEPPNQLKGFSKVVLTPAVTQRVTMRLDRSSLSAWDAETSQWVVHPGTYTVRVGTSSRDLPQKATVSVDRAAPTHVGDSSRSRA